MIRKNNEKEIKAKIDGNISSFEDGEEFMRFGADKLGTSRAIKIIKFTDRGASY